jgi:hypothetical protein
MYDVCMDSLPFFITTTVLAIAIVRCWDLFVGLVTD